MGIQGLGGYLDNNDFTVNFDITNPVNNTFKYMYLDFQSIIYTIFNYQENLINLLSSVLSNYDDTNTNIDNNKLIFGIMEKIRLLIKDTNFGKNLFKLTKTVPGFGGTMRTINIDFIDKEFKYADGALYQNISVIEDVADCIKNYDTKKMDFVRNSIIEQITDLISKFNNLEECYIVFDGKPLVAKMIEQVKRRAPDAVLSQIINDVKTSLLNQSLFKQPTNIFFDRSVISKDSDFVTDLISEFIALDLKVKSNPAKKLKLEIISTEDGEGEHIINKKILAKVDEGVDGNFLYYSPDGDVVFLILILNMLIRKKGKTNYVNLIKFELIDYTYYKFETKFPYDGIIMNLKDYMKEPISIESKIIKIQKILSQTGIYLQFNNIFNFEDSLLSNINKRFGYNKRVGRINKKLILKKDLLLMQYIILFTFFGNDFLPKLISMSIGQMDEIAELYNNYLEKTAKANLKEFLNQAGGDFTKFNLLANFDGRKITLNKNVLLDFLKELCKYQTEHPEKCEVNEDITIIKKLNNESKKTSKNFKEFMENFGDIKTLFNYDDKVSAYEFIKYLLNGNYYIGLNNLKLTPEKLREYSTDLARISVLLGNPARTFDESTELETLEKKYYKEVIYQSSYKYLDYYFNGNENPTKVDNERIVTETRNKAKLIKRVVPFNEIISFDSKMHAEDEQAISQYIQGLQYVADLYFTGNVSNKCWYYQYENPPKIHEFVKYMETNIANDLFNYTGFYGASHESLYDQISQKLTRSVNIKYLKNLHTVKYYNLDKIFHCFNIRYMNKCQIKGDNTIVFLDSTGKLVNIISSSYNTSDTNTKLKEILRLAQELLVGGNISTDYYKKYLKYKLKYMKLKKLI